MSPYGASVNISNKQTSPEMRTSFDIGSHVALNEVTVDCNCEVTCQITATHPIVYLLQHHTLILEDSLPHKPISLRPLVEEVYILICTDFDILHQFVNMICLIKDKSSMFDHF